MVLTYLLIPSMFPVNCSENKRCGSKSGSFPLEDYFVCGSEAQSSWGCLSVLLSIVSAQCLDLIIHCRQESRANSLLSSAVILSWFLFDDSSSLFDDSEEQLGEKRFITKDKTLDSFSSSQVSKYPALQFRQVKVLVVLFHFLFLRQGLT